MKYCIQPFGHFLFIITSLVLFLISIQPMIESAMNVQRQCELINSTHILLINDTNYYLNFYEDKIDNIILEELSILKNMTMMISVPCWYSGFDKILTLQNKHYPIGYYIIQFIWANFSMLYGTGQFYVYLRNS